MGGRPLKKVTQPGSDLDLPFISFRYDENTRSIYLRVVDPKSLGRREGNVMGFEIVYNPVYTIQSIKRKEFDRWIERGFEDLLVSTLQKVFEENIILRDWFPSVESHEVDVTSFYSHTTIYGRKVTEFIVTVSLTVRFSEGIPYDKFMDNFTDFISTVFTLRGFFEEIDNKVEAMILEKFHNAYVSVDTESPPKYRLFIGGTKSDIDLKFIDTVIWLNNPLSEGVLESLVKSSDEREFVFKFSILIDPSNVRRVSVLHLGWSDFWSNDINGIKKLLMEVASLLPA